MAVEIWKDAVFVDLGTTGGYYDGPQSVELSNGNVLIVWTEADDIVSPASDEDIWGAVYDPEGNLLKAPWHMTGGYASNRTELDPKIAATDDGGFVMVFSYINYDTQDSDVIWTSFNSDFNFVGDYVLNDASGGGGSYAPIEIVTRPGKDGSMLIYSYHDIGDGSPWWQHFSYRTFNAAGDLEKAEFLLNHTNAYTSIEYPTFGDAVVLEDGRVAAATKFSNAVRIHLIETDDTPGPWYETAIPSGYFYSDLISYGDSGWITWFSKGDDLRGNIVDTVARTNEWITLESERSYDSIFGTAVALEDGTFVSVGWDAAGTFAQHHASDGQALGEAVSLSEYGEAYIELEVLQDGRVSVTWRQWPGYGSTDTVFAIVDTRTNPNISVDDGSVTTALRNTDTKIAGSDLPDTFYGREGNDTLLGGGSFDLIFGGAGHDYIEGGDGHDTLTGDGGLDFIKGGNQDDWLMGGDGSDSLIGGAGNDLLDGGAGDDLLIGDESAGADWFLFA